MNSEVRRGKINDQRTSKFRIQFYVNFKQCLYPDMKVVCLHDWDLRIEWNNTIKIGIRPFADVKLADSMNVKMIKRRKARDQLAHAKHSCFPAN